MGCPAPPPKKNLASQRPKEKKNLEEKRKTGHGFWD